MHILFTLAISVAKRDLTVTLIHIFDTRQNPFNILVSLNCTTNKPVPEKESCLPLCAETALPQANPLISAFKSTYSASTTLLTWSATDGSCTYIALIKIVRCASCEMGFSLSPVLHQGSARSAFGLQLNPRAYLCICEYGAPYVLYTIKSRIVIET